MEPLRDEQFILGHGVPASLVMSILFIIFGVIGIGLLLFFNYRKEHALLGSKEGDPCGITQYLSPNKNEQPYYSKINLLGANYPPKPSKEELKRLKKAGKGQSVSQQADVSEEQSVKGEEPKTDPRNDSSEPNEEQKEEQRSREETEAPKENGEVSPKRPKTKKTTKK